MSAEFQSAMEAMSEMEDFEEFEAAVDRVSGLIRDLASGKIKPEDVDDELVKKPKPKRKGNVFNDRPETSGSTMSQEAFMRVVEEDANRRAKERKERNLKSDDLKDKGNAAFRKGDFQKALAFFNNALDVRRDSSVLYVNRALTNLKLRDFEKVGADCDSALRLNDSLKPRLLKMRAFYEMGDLDRFEETLNEAYRKFPDQQLEIDDYISEWRVATVGGRGGD